MDICIHIMENVSVRAFLILFSVKALDISDVCVVQMIITALKTILEGTFQLFEGSQSNNLKHPQ